jgi:hypothetical protein
MMLPAMLRPGMRGYLIPLAAGITLIVSAFLPWIRIDDVVLTGFPDVLALWVIGLGALAAILAALSLITRRNSRHPLFVIGLAALGIMFLSWRIMPQSIDNRARTRAQAIAIVDQTTPQTPPHALVGSGIYLGLVAAMVIVGFGLTIVVRRVATPYAVSSTDDDA